MQENYLIQLNASITTEDDTETVELTTTGAFYIKDGKYYVCYKESSATGFEGSMTTIKICENSANITRYGDHPSILSIEEGVTNICNYETIAGALILEIIGVKIKHNLSEKGGDISLSYTINSSGMFISENNITINIKEL